MRHPLADRNVSEFAQHLDDLVTRKRVRCNDSGDLRIFKYVDNLRNVSLEERCARGLIMSKVPLRFVNFPMAKFDEIARYCDDMTEYHDRIQAALPAHAYVQPKLDGTNIHAVCLEDGRRVVSTLQSFSNAQVDLANAFLKDARWDVGVTLCFELVHSDDPKVQRRRVANGLYLLYGCDGDGTILSRDSLLKLANKLGVLLVKQQKLPKDKIVAHMRRLDACESISDVQEGMVLHKEDGTLLHLKSWKYLLCANAKLPTRAWLSEIVKQAQTMNDVHDAVEGFVGPLDSELKAHALLIGALTRSKETLDDAKLSFREEMPSSSCSSALLIKMTERPVEWIDGEEALLMALRSATAPD